MNKDNSDIQQTDKIHICHLSTAKIDYMPLEYENKFDITVKTGYGIGKYFAPRWDMVMNSKHGIITWNEYRKQYLDLMRDRYFKDKQPFLDILNKEYPVICCYCQDTHSNIKHCHRYILVEILQKIAELHTIEFVYNGEKR